MIQPTILSIIASTVGNPFGLPMYGGVLTLPPVIDALLVWLKGDDDGTDLKLDSRLAPDAENFKITGSACASLNGTDEYGTLSSIVTLEGYLEIDFGFVVADSGGALDPLFGGDNSTEGELTIVPATATFLMYIGGVSAAYTNITATSGEETVGKFKRVGDQGTLTIGSESQTLTVSTADVVIRYFGRYIHDRFGGGLFWYRLRDATQDYFFRIAETSSLTSFSDNYPADGMSVAWSADVGTLWAQQQDTYPGNALGGYGNGENLLQFSENLSNPYWDKVDTVVDVDNNITFAGASSYLRGDFECIIGENTCEIELSGDGTINIALYNTTDGYFSKNTVTLTSTPQVFTISGDATVVTQTRFYFGTLSSFSPTSSAGTAREVAFSYAVAGQNIAPYIKTEDVTFSGSEYLPFLNTYPGGTWNDCESSFAPEGFPTGSPNGVDHTITMLADHGTIVSHGSLDTSVPTYVHPTITFTAGTVRDILFSDGTFMQLREGEGSNLYDADGVLVGTLNGDPAAWWAGAYQVAQSIIDAEAIQGSTVFTDGAGHPEPRTQTWLEANLNVNKQHYFCEQLLLYDRVLTDPEDGLIKDYLPCWTVTYLADTNGNKLVDGNVDYLATIVEN